MLTLQNVQKQACVCVGNRIGNINSVFVILKLQSKSQFIKATLPFLLHLHLEVVVFIVFFLFLIFFVPFASLLVSIFCHDFNFPWLILLTFLFTIFAPRCRIFNLSIRRHWESFFKQLFVFRVYFGLPL